MVKTYVVQRLDAPGRWRDVLTTTNEERARHLLKELGEVGRLLEFSSTKR